MTVGFDEKNLDAATVLLTKLAVMRDSPMTFAALPRNKRYDVSDSDAAREYLMDRVQAYYEENSESIVVGQIAFVPYYSIGAVFESNLGEGGPAPGSATSPRPKHIVMFWQTL